MKAKENQFRADRIESLKFRFEDDDMESVLERLAEMDYRGAIVGPKGSGKTTLIEEIESELSVRKVACTMLRLKEDSRRTNVPILKEWLASTLIDSVLLLDSAGQLNWWDWKRFESQSRSYRGLIITTHQPGRLPTLVECQPNLITFLEMCEELAPDVAFSKEQLTELFGKHHGNIRDCFRTLYDQPEIAVK